MIRTKTDVLEREIVIDLDGPDGNAFALMGYATKFAKDLSYEKEEIDDLMKRMQSGDYENLLNVFDKEFGDFVVLERSPCQLLRKDNNKLKPNKSKYGTKPTKHRRRTLNPTEKIDLAWEMLKAWKKTPVDQRPSWLTFKNDFYRSKFGHVVPDIMND